MINRYYGNTGRVVRMEEPQPPRQQPSQQTRRPTKQPDSRAGVPLNRARPQAQGAPPPEKRKSQNQKPPHGGTLGGIFDGLGGIMSRATTRLETEDIILLIMLYLLYRESGDDEWLIIMGALLFM